METTSPELTSPPVPRHVRWLLQLLVLCWIGVILGDWFLRFHWHHWERTLIARPTRSSSPGPFPPNRRAEVPASKGGDLTHLSGIDDVLHQFGIERPAAVDITDEFGFRNVPPVSNRTFDAVLVGDSFMVHGQGNAETLSARLAAATGLSVYNLAVPGLGPVLPVARLFQADRFREHPPRWLIWGLVEREISGDILVGLPWYLQHGVSMVGVQKTHVNWPQLLPRNLSQELPNTSVLAQLCRRTWNRLRYEVLGQLTPDLAVSVAPIEGRPVLFYAPAVRALRWTREERKPEVMADVLAQVTRYAREHGSELVVLLIPDKEQVYRDKLPPRLVPPAHPITYCVLDELEQLAAPRGVRVVNLTAPFRREAARDRLLYWPDDTHWNESGIDLAVSELARALSASFDSGEAHDHTK